MWQTYAGSMDGLSKPVAFLVVMHKIPRLPEKLQLMVDLRAVHAEISTVMAHVDTLSTACDHVRLTPLTWLCCASGLMCFAGVRCVVCAILRWAAHAHAQLERIMLRATHRSKW